MNDVYDIWASVVIGDSGGNAEKFVFPGYSRKDIYDGRISFGKDGTFTAGQRSRAESFTLREASRIMEFHEKRGINSIWANDPGFPRRLLGYPDGPVAIYYKGDLSLLSSPRTAGIVGSRHCDGEGESVCRSIAGGLAQKGVTVISGLARGMDTIAHRSCVESGGRTVGIVGRPLGDYYPRQNKAFQQQLERDHLVICEYPAGREYKSYSFVRRNRLIARRADVLCVVQAGMKSGSMSTVNRALEYGKPVFAPPGGIYNKLYEGTNYLLARRKAYAVLGPGEILDYFGIEENSRDENEEGPDLSSLSGEAQLLYSWLDGRMSRAGAARRAGMSRLRANTRLSALEIEGFVKRTSDGLYIKTK